jgi:hypothetical protein
MVKRINKTKPDLVKPSLIKPDTDPSDLPVVPASKEDELDSIPDEDEFETPPYEPPPEGEGP